MLLLIILTIMEKEMSKVVAIQTPAPQTIKCHWCRKEVDPVACTYIDTYNLVCIQCQLEKLGLRQPAVWKKKPVSFLYRKNWGMHK